MLDPEYLRNVADGSEKIASDLHDYIIDRLVTRVLRRIGKGKDYMLSGTDRWSIETLQESGYLFFDISCHKRTKRNESKSLTFDVLQCFFFTPPQYSAARLLS